MLLAVSSVVLLLTAARAATTPPAYALADAPPVDQLVQLVTNACLKSVSTPLAGLSAQLTALSAVEQTALPAAVRQLHEAQQEAAQQLLEAQQQAVQQAALPAAVQQLQKAQQQLVEAQQQAAQRVIDSQQETFQSLRNGQKTLGRQLARLAEELTLTPAPTPEPVQQCPSGWTSAGDQCFLIPAGTSSWLTANAECARRDPRSRLASVHAGTVTLIETLTSSKLWVGLSQNSGSAPWMWTDGSTLDYTNWDRGLNQPDGSGLKNERCVLIDNGRGGGWHDYPCDWSFKYLCQIYLNK